MRKLAQQIAKKIRLVRSYFPNAQIGTADVVDESGPWVDELVEWTDVYRRVTGEPLAFFHADVAWSRAAVSNLAPLVRALNETSWPMIAMPPPGAVSPAMVRLLEQPTELVSVMVPPTSKIMILWLWLTASGNEPGPPGASVVT